MFGVSLVRAQTPIAIPHPTLWVTPRAHTVSDIMVYGGLLAARTRGGVLDETSG